MPASYRIDRERRLVTSIVDGVLTFEDVVDHNKRLSSDPEFDPTFNHLVDFTRLTKSEIRDDQVKYLAASPIFKPPSRQACAVTKKLEFGVLRMYQSYLAREQFGVFYELSNAISWLNGNQP